MKFARIGAVAVVGFASVAAAGVALAQQSNLSFFVTSVGSPKGADFGGLAGADKHCQTLAAAVGVAAGLRGSGSPPPRPNLEAMRGISATRRFSTSP